jgi:hypothetical protein
MITENSHKKEKKQPLKLEAFFYLSKNLRDE